MLCDYCGLLGTCDDAGQVETCDKFKKESTVADVTERAIYIASDSKDTIEDCCRQASKDVLGGIDTEVVAAAVERIWI